MNVLANEPATQNGGKAFGIQSIGTASAGLAVLALFSTYQCIFSQPSRRSGQTIVGALLSVNVAILILEAVLWQTGGPAYPWVSLGLVTGGFVGSSAMIAVMPFIATHYGGWLVGPVRMGSDLSSLFTGLAAQAQNPTGNHNLFPTWVLLSCYAGITVMGLVSWCFIVAFGIGLRQEPVAANAIDLELDMGSVHENTEDASSRSSQHNAQDASTMSSSSKRSQKCAWPSTICSLMGLEHEWTLNLSCPQEMFVPVFFAVSSQVAQWAIANSFTGIGAHMTDPEGCEGHAGKRVLRTALTLSWVMCAVGSMFACIGWCPRSVFVALGLFQLVACMGVCLVTFGAFRAFTTTELGQNLYITCFALTAGLEGLVLATAYRYVGDSPTLSKIQRSRTSNLLGFLSIVTVCVPQIIFGNMVRGGAIKCMPP